MRVDGAPDLPGAVPNKHFPDRRPGATSDKHWQKHQVRMAICLWITGCQTLIDLEHTTLPLH